MASVGAVFAQKGESAVGVNLGVAPSLESGYSLTNFGIGAKYQYGITDALRAEADLDYWFKAKGISAFDASANIHYLFNVSETFKVYPLVGIGYARLKADWSIGFDNDADDYTEYYNEDGEGYEEIDGGSASVNKLLVNAGIGAEYALTENLSLGLEVKYQYIKDFSRLPISLGLTYKF